MNKDFWRPAVFLVLGIIMLGFLAMLIPACENKTLPIKKMKWFEALRFSKPKTAIANTVSPDQAEKIESILSPLQKFQQELKAQKRNPGKSLRIAYYGDSIIEGDLITGMLRHEMQIAYGGKGIGFVPITSIVAGFRPTIRHSFSKNWEAISFMSQGKRDIPLGICGFTFIPRPFYSIEKAVEPTLDTLAVLDSITVVPEKKETRKIYVNTPAWVKYQAQAGLGGADSFERMRLFYSNASDSSYVLCSIDNKEAKTYRLTPGEGINVLDLSAGYPVKTLYLEFNPRDPIHVYGVSFDQANGSYVDSFTIRGYSGMYFQRIPQHILRSFQNHLDYDLVVLHYGENVSHPKVKDYSFYYRGMEKTIKHIQASMPEVPILLISAHDRSIKENGIYITSPDIPLLVSKQGEIARDTDCAFWNLYEAMGGSNSMADYVQKGLAQKDYTHFNRSGANHIGKQLFELITREN